MPAGHAQRMLHLVHPARAARRARAVVEQRHHSSSSKRTAGRRRRHRVGVRAIGAAGMAHPFRPSYPSATIRPGAAAEWDPVSAASCRWSPDASRWRRARRPPPPALALRQPSPPPDTPAPVTGLTDGRGARDTECAGHIICLGAAFVVRPSAARGRRRESPAIFEFFRAAGPVGAMAEASGEYLRLAAGATTSAGPDARRMPDRREETIAHCCQREARTAPRHVPRRAIVGFRLEPGGITGYASRRPSAPCTAPAAEGTPMPRIIFPKQAMLLAAQDERRSIDLAPDGDHFRPLRRLAPHQLEERLRPAAVGSASSCL